MLTPLVILFLAAFALMLAAGASLVYLGVTDR
jgi:hypothetical protein